MAGPMQNGSGKQNNLQNRLETKCIRAGLTRKAKQSIIATRHQFVGTGTKGNVNSGLFDGKVVLPEMKIKAKHKKVR